MACGALQFISTQRATDGPGDARVRVADVRDIVASVEEAAAPHVHEPRALAADDQQRVGVRVGHGLRGTGDGSAQRVQPFRRRPLGSCIKEDPAHQFSSRRAPAPGVRQREPFAA